MVKMEGNSSGGLDRRQLPYWHKSSNCMRNKPVRMFCVVLGWLVACGVGAVLWKTSLESMEQEFLLKCENRKEIIKSEVENNLNASFVIVGLVASLPQLNESIWLSFTRQTLFLRPNVKKLVYMKRVLASDRAAFEAQWNSSIMGYANGNLALRTNDTEYSPILFETEDLSYLFFDPASLPILKTAIYHARDTGRFTLSPATGVGNVWGMGAYLAYYGVGNDTSSFSNNADRQQACQGYVATMLNVTEIFGRVLSRFVDDVDMDVVAVYQVNTTVEGLSSYYNCSQTAITCALPLFDPAHRINEVDDEVAAVTWEYGTQMFELRCLPKHNLKLLALRTIIAWPLLMSMVVLFFSIIVFLVLKRMQAIEKDVSVMEKMNVDLKAAKLAAEAADRAKSSFLATVSHEIRTPMNGVIGMTNLLMGTELTAQQLDYVKVAQASGNALIALINDVLDLSKIEAGKMELESVPYNIRKEVDGVFFLFDEKLQQKKLEVSMLVHEAVPTCVVGDPGRFRQILVNLVGNALKFTKEGSILVCVRVMDPHYGQDSETGALSQKARAQAGDIQLSQVLPNDSPDQGLHYASGVLGSNDASLERGNTAPRLSMQPGDALNTREAVALWRDWKLTTTSGRACKPPKNFTVIVSVEDTGIGIPLHLQHRLFQPFSQADSSTSREYGGTGIGLSICQKLVKLMNGRLTVRSKPGVGSVFEFTLPLCVPEVEQGESKLSCCSKTTVSDDAKLRGMHVVLVDCNLVRQEVTASYLRCLGIQIEFTDDVQSTVDFLERPQHIPVRAVLVDLKGLTHASTLELARYIRKKSSLQALPVLALAMNLGTSAEKELKEAGISYVVSKPLRYSTLAAVLLQTIGVQVRAPMKKVNMNAKMLVGRRLLVVDDNMVNRRVATSMLSRYGATVMSVNGGVEAVESVKKQNEGEKFDLVLMDIQMPEMDGWEATRQIRKWEVESCEVCQLTGMDDYITKPLDQKQLHSLLERFLKSDLVNTPQSSCAPAAGGSSCC